MGNHLLSSRFSLQHFLRVYVAAAVGPSLWRHFFTLNRPQRNAILRAQAGLNISTEERALPRSPEMTSRLANERQGSSLLRDMRRTWRSPRESPLISRMEPRARHLPLHLAHARAASKRVLQIINRAHVRARCAHSPRLCNRERERERDASGQRRDLKESKGFKSAGESV